MTEEFINSPSRQGGQTPTLRVNLLRVARPLIQGDNINYSRFSLRNALSCSSRRPVAMMLLYSSSTNTAGTPVTL